MNTFFGSLLGSGITSVEFFAFSFSIEKKTFKIQKESFSDQIFFQKLSRLFFLTFELSFRFFFVLKNVKKCIFVRTFPNALPLHFLDSRPSSYHDIIYGSSFYVSKMYIQYYAKILHFSMYQNVIIIYTYYNIT